MFNVLFKKLMQRRTETVINRVSPYLKNTDKIVDIGSGSGDIAKLLQDRGLNITPVDVADYHYPRVIDTTIYDGKKLPFPDKSFDKALLLMVLHHTPDPKLVFDEAARVAAYVVVIETSYTNPINRLFTIILDAIGNLRLEAFWDSYKTNAQWREFFAKRGFDVVESKKYNDKNMLIFPFSHILYYTKKGGAIKNESNFSRCDRHICY